MLSGVKFNGINSSRGHAVPGITSASNYYIVVQQDVESVFVWGMGSIGQLGLGDMVEHQTPTAVPALPLVVTVEAGYWHSLSLGINYWHRTGLGLQ